MRSRSGPYFRRMRITRFTPSPSMSKPSIYPSDWRIDATASFSLETGHWVVSSEAAFALRTRVSMSASGSVMLTLPTRFRDAGDLAPMCQLAHTQPAHAELSEVGAGAPAPPASIVPATLELRRPLGLVDQRLFRHALSVPLFDCPVRPTSGSERKAECPEQCPALVVVGCRRDERHVHPPDLAHLVVLDLGEDQLLGDTERVVAVPVELPGGQPAEVPDPRQRRGQQPVEELPHPVAPERDLAADGHAGAELEAGDRLLGLRDDGLLPRDDRQIGHGVLESLAVAQDVADAHVDDDLLERWDRHDVQSQLGRKLRADLGPVALLQPRDGGGFDGCHLQLALTLAADAHLDALAVHPEPHTRRPARPADQRHVGQIDRELHGDDAALLPAAATLGGADLLVALHPVDTLHQHPALVRQDGDDASLLAEILPGQHPHPVALP